MKGNLLTARTHPVKKKEKICSTCKKPKNGSKLLKMRLAKYRQIKFIKTAKNSFFFLKEFFKSCDIQLKATEIKTLLKAFSEKDETADICMDGNGNPEPDTESRDYENIPLLESIDDYFKREVLPYVPDTWMDRGKDKIGYEINFTK